jgi:signal transduction histidine kinase
MERFTRECLEMEVAAGSNTEASARMDQVYATAVKMVANTLDLDGCVILDIRQFEYLDVGSGKMIYRANPFGQDGQDESAVLERDETFGHVAALPVLASVPAGVSTRTLSPSEHEKLSDFLLTHREGRIFENIAPTWIRYLFPSALKYGMVVPIFGVDQQPFALICAYTSDKAKQFLEGYELQFLRAIGVVILSAVLKRRMVLADKAKSILISSVSHELRTPLHGILAAAELLSDTPLDANQTAFLKTVQTCGNSLIETVNHVLDFTKLSGSGKGAGVQLHRVNLSSLVEQTVEGCYIGQRARFFHGESDIGSFYAPPPTDLPPKNQRAAISQRFMHVEAVIDVAPREKVSTIAINTNGRAGTFDAKKEDCAAC